jgi:membrane fusion protein (multidrug efflux system)
MKRMKVSASLVFLLLVAMLQWGCGGKSKANANNKKDEKVVVPVEVGAVIQGDIAAYLTGTATIEAEEETEVVAKVGGVVEKILIEEGDVVRAGQALAKLDDEKISVELTQARANLNRLESNYQRNKDLHAKQLVSTEVFQQSKYEYEQQQAAYELAELNLKYASIRTPISGVISERLIKVGNMILPNQPVFHVTGLNPLIAVLYVPEGQLKRLREGLKAQLAVDAVENEVFTGRIKRMSPVVDPETGTVKVTIETQDESGLLRPGMFARIKIIYDVHENIVKAPKDAIIAEDRMASVFVVQDSLAIRRNITIGYTNTTHVEILEGLAVGDTVVTTGKGSLKDSTGVEIVTK